MLAGFGSAAPATEESYLDDVHTTFDGRALAVVRPTGRRDHHGDGDGGRLRPGERDGRGPVSRCAGGSSAPAGSAGRRPAICT